MDRDSFTWLRFVTLSGREGKRWVEDFEQVRPLVQLCRECVAQLRLDREHRNSEVLLQRVRKSLDVLDGHVDPSLISATERWYYGALGFHFYSQRAFNEADDSMSRAHAAVAKTVDSRQCLLGLAYDCFELELHRARIARDQCLWDRMREHVEASAAMRAGRRPFCVTSNGMPIMIGAVRAFYTSLPNLTDDDRAGLADIIDETRVVPVERLVRSMFRLSGFVIEYA